MLPVPVSVFERMGAVRRKVGLLRGDGFCHTIVGCFDLLFEKDGIMVCA